MAEATSDDHPVDNAFFMPVGAHGPAQHGFEGTLSVPEFGLHLVWASTTTTATDLAPAYIRFPAVDLEFFLHGDRLVPTERGIIWPSDGTSKLGIIVSPGRVWSEPGDDGLSRASFPFTLVTARSNNSHNGIATFLFDDMAASSFRFQIVQEAAAWAMTDGWGQSPMAYRTHPIQNREALAEAFETEMAQAMPMRPWSDLEALAASAQLPEILHRKDEIQSVSVAGLIVDDAIYAHPCRARYGDYPYCREMRHGVYSVTKTMGAALTLLRLAQKYGPEVFDLKIKDYVDIDSDHDGWDSVTFAHALGMAVGTGYRSHERKPVDFAADEDNNTLFAWLDQVGATAKLAMTFRVNDDYPWGPGEVARYDTMHTFILATAMDGFLKSREGPDADLWDMVQQEVFEPIGAFHVPIMRTAEGDGSRGLPIMGFGLYLTIDDAAKIARLFHNGGVHDGVQLLHAEKLAEALYQRGRRGLATRTVGFDHDYHLSFWLWRYAAGGGCRRWLPVMSGYGGNAVLVLPNGITAFRFADGHHYDWSDLVAAAHTVRPLCAEG
jgi:hypothetical protein